MVKIHSELNFNKMETSKILFKPEIGNNEETPTKIGEVKLLKSVLIIFILLLITLLSSCFVRGSGHERHVDKHKDYQHLSQPVNDKT